MPLPQPLMVFLGLMWLGQAWAEDPPNTMDTVAGRLSEEAPERIGDIEIDRRAGRFRVPGMVTRLEPPLEYLAVSHGGAKAYESLLELDADGVEFNTACILIGLEMPAPDAKPRFQFDEEPVDGQQVELAVSWEDGSVLREARAERLLTADGVPVDEAKWVYIGSFFLAGERYAAQESGTLIGFVHDPVSVIEHREGLGIGRYGAIAGNAELAPPPRSRVWLTVINPSGRAKDAEAGGE